MSKFKEWRQEIFRNKKVIILSLIFLCVAITLYSAAGSYAQRKNTVKVPDMILDNIPTVDLDFIFIYGFTAIILIFFAYPLFFKVDKLHVAISQFSLLILIRSFFVTLTHLSLPANALVFDTPNFFALLDFKNALFFSGHTAVPFLGFLLFKAKKIKALFLISTIVLATTVLLMHVHYSIDVFAALFITYGSFKIGNWLFKGIN
jgi:hypothetical protein